MGEERHISYLDDLITMNENRVFPMVWQDTIDRIIKHRDEKNAFWLVMEYYHDTYLVVCQEIDDNFIPESVFGRSLMDPVYSHDFQHHGSFEYKFGQIELTKQKINRYLSVDARPEARVGYELRREYIALHIIRDLSYRVEYIYTVRFIEKRRLLIRIKRSLRLILLIRNRTNRHLPIEVAHYIATFI